MCSGYETFTMTSHILGLKGKLNLNKLKQLKSNKISSLVKAEFN